MYFGFKLVCIAIIYIINNYYLAINIILKTHFLLYCHSVYFVGLYGILYFYVGYYGIHSIP